LFFSLIMNVVNLNSSFSNYLMKIKTSIRFFDNMSFEVMLCILILFVAMIRISLGYFLIKRIGLFCMNLCRKIGLLMYNHVFSKNYLDLKKLSSNQLLFDIIYGAERYSFTFIYGSLEIISNTILLVIFLIILIYSNPLITLPILCAVYIATSSFTKIMKKKSSFISEREKVATPGLNKVVIESSQGIVDLKVNNMMSLQEKRYIKKMNVFSDNHLNKIVINFFPSRFAELMVLFVVFLAFLIGDIFDVNNAVTPFLGLFGIIGFRMVPVSNKINTMINIMYQNLWVIENFKTFFNKDKSENIRFGGKDNFSFKKRIHIKNLNFRYDDNRDYIFQNLNVEIKKGQAVGISGSSGKGKSTLISILSGLIDSYEGDIIFDDKNISTFNRESIFSSFSIVSQNNFVFNDSIKNNIVIDDDIPIIDSELEKVLKIVNLDGLINSLPNGLDTIVGEQGSKISGGQRQRICIARSIFQKPDILILDEPTSALDESIANKIIDNIIGSKNGMTTIIVSHDQKVLSKCDLIINL